MYPNIWGDLVELQTLIQEIWVGLGFYHPCKLPGGADAGLRSKSPEEHHRNGSVG